jgi:hypothetical protein
VASQGLAYVVLVRNPDFKVDVVCRQRQLILSCVTTMNQLQRLYGVESVSKSSFGTSIASIVEPDRNIWRVVTHSTYLPFLLSPHATKTLPQKWLNYSFQSVRRGTSRQSRMVEWGERSSPFSNSYPHRLWKFVCRLHYNWAVNLPVFLPWSVRSYEYYTLWRISYLLLNEEKTFYLLFKFPHCVKHMAKQYKP